MHSVSDAVEPLDTGRSDVGPDDAVRLDRAVRPGGHDSQLGALLDAASNEEHGAETTDQSALDIIHLLGYKAGPGTWSIYDITTQWKGEMLAKQVASGTC